MDNPDRPYSGRTTEERRAERRGRMMDAALELFGTDGYRVTSIEKLCAAAAVSTRNFYEEFTGREALLIAIYEHIMGQGYAAARDAADGLASDLVIERMDTGIAAFIDTTFADPRMARIAFVEVLGVGPAVEERRLAWREQAYAQFAELTARMVAGGQAVDRDYSLTAMAYSGAFNELVYEWARAGTQVPVAAVVSELSRMVRAAIVTA